MANLNREQLIKKLEQVRTKDILIPTDVLGRRVFVKATKGDLIERIRKEFKENEQTNISFRVYKHLNQSVLQPKHLPKKSVADLDRVAPSV